MITQKEKIAIEIIYNEYKKDKNSDKIYMKANELISKSSGRLTLPDLHALILHGNSQYIGFQGVTDSTVKITPQGIAYMENGIMRIIEKTGFWVTVLASVLAATYAILTYYIK